MRFRTIILFATLYMFWVRVLIAQPAQPSWNVPPDIDTVRNFLPVTETNLKMGQKLYDQFCTMCHGYTGHGDGPAAAAMNPKPADHTSAYVQTQSDGSLFYKISYGRGLMVPYHSTLSVKQRWQLVLYIRSMAAPPVKSSIK